MELLSPGEATERYGYSRATLLRLEEEGKLNPIRTSPHAHRRYQENELQNLANQPVGLKQPPYTEMGVTGTRKWGGSIYEERLRELRGRPGRILYHEMRLNDPTIAAVFFAIENTLKQARWRVKPASEQPIDLEAAKFLDTCFQDMSFSWSDTMAFVLTELEQGFSVLELNYKKRLGANPPHYCKDPAPSQYTDGRIGWRKWAPRPADSLADGDEWIMDNAGGVQGIKQQPETWGTKVYEIPIEKLLLFRTTPAPSNGPEGQSMLRTMYTSYYFSKNLQEIEGIGIERDLAGIPVMYLGGGTTLSGANSDFELAKDIVTNLRNDEQAGVVIPHPKMNAEGQGILLELLSANASRSHDVSGVIERYDKRKTLTVLAQFIMLGMERVGSYALSKHQGDLFNISVQAWLTGIADVINRYAIPRLFAYNVFPGITGLPQYVPSDTGIPNLVEISTYINTLVNNNLLTPDAELERHLRQMARFPEPPEGITNERAPRNVDASAMLLRRVLSSLQQMQQIGETPENITEMQEMVQGLVNELAVGLGTSQQ